MPVEATYTLIPDQPIISAGAAAAAARTPKKFADFLGYGIVTPFQRGPSDFNASGGVELLGSMISQVVGTMSDSDFTQGELPWRSEFGSILHHLRHRKNDSVLGELARVYVAEAIARWVPQIRMKDIQTSKETGPNGDESVLLIRMKYDVIGLNKPGNEVLLPDQAAIFEINVA